MITFEYDDNGRLMAFKDGEFVGYIETMADDKQPSKEQEV